MSMPMSLISCVRPLAAKRMFGASKLLTKCVHHATSRSISSSRMLLANVTVEVPALGESISEGSVSSFEKAVGDFVDVDDVIAVIETDKVTVDIKSPYKGTLVELLCEVSDEVTVGGPLYTIDTNDSLIAPVSSEQTEAAKTPTETPSSSTKTNSHNASKRVPLIKFLGKRSLLKAPPSSSPPPSSTETISSSSSGYTLIPVASSYDGYDTATLGRPLLTEAEMEAVETGGASLFV